jgi:hypothetical protein
MLRRSAAQLGANKATSTSSSSRNVDNAAIEQDIRWLRVVARMNVLYSAISSEIHCAGSDGSKLEAPVLPVPNAAGTPSASLITTPADRDSHCRVTVSYYFLHVSLTVHGFPHRSNIDKSTTSDRDLSQNRTSSESQSQLTQLSNNRTTQLCDVLCF